ncbi:MAG: PilN domain-containing protein [Gammaproteobacteria bacterium]|nr:PilN domain-containing protein [Gammaproteobacteria bacterium]
MQQQINLYQPVAAQKDEPFSALMMLIIVAITLLLMMGFYAMLQWKKNNLQAEMGTLKIQYEQTLATVEKLEATVIRFTDAKKEQQQFKRLKKIYSSKENALNELSTMVKGNSYGVSECFSALARKNIEPVWFSDINVYSGGQQIFLQGQTTNTQHIPQFVASLKEESFFNGVNFKLFKAKKIDTGSLVHFSLQTEVSPSKKRSSQR